MFSLQGEQIEPPKNAAGKKLGLSTEGTITNHIVRSFLLLGVCNSYLKPFCQIAFLGHT
jgi:hypothetical protein